MNWLRSLNPWSAVKCPSIGQNPVPSDYDETLSQPSPEIVPQPLEILDTCSNPQQINVWFDSTPRDHLVSLLADTIDKWGGEDLGRLRLAERGLSQDEIVTLLSTRRRFYPIIHFLVTNSQGSTLTSLLGQVTCHKRLLSVVQLNNWRGPNVLSYAFELNNLDVYDFLVYRLREDGSTNIIYDLLELVNPDSTLQQIDAWFDSTPREHLRSRLADTIRKWGGTDLSRLRLEKRGLSQDAIVELLKSRPRGSVDPVINLLVEFGQTSTFTFLLDQLTTPHHLISVARLKDRNGKTVLGCALARNQSDMYKYLVKRLREDGSISNKFKYFHQDLVDILDPESTPEQIEAWFYSTPHEHMISPLADTIKKWGVEDMSRLRLAERGLSQEDVVKLLKMKSSVYNPDGKPLMGMRSDPVIHLLLIHNQTLTLTRLLERITSPQQLLSIILCKSLDERNVLSRAIMLVRSNIYHHLVKHLDEHGYFNLIFDLLEILGPYSTSRQIEAWFDSTPREHLISRVADTIEMWGDEELHSLKLAERGLSQDDIIQLLKRKRLVFHTDNAVLALRPDPIIHILVMYNQAATLSSLLDQIESPRQLLSLVRLTGSNQRNVLSHALKRKRMEIYDSLVKRLGEDRSSETAYICDCSIYNPFNLLKTLHPEFTNRQIGAWFDSIPREHLISRLADTIRNWGDEDLSRLRLSERALSQDDIIQLLKRRRLIYQTDTTVIGLRSDPIIHILVIYNQAATLSSLLDQITSPRQLLSLVRLTGSNQRNVLSHALKLSKTFRYDSLVKQLGEHGISNTIYDCAIYNPFTRGSGEHEDTSCALSWDRSDIYDYLVMRLVENGTSRHLIYDLTEVEIVYPDLTRRQIDAWFRSTPRQHLISRLDISFEKWSDENFGRLRLAKRGLSEECILELLKTGSPDPVIHRLMIHSQTPTFTFLLDQVTSPNNLRSLVQLRGSNGLNVLSRALESNSLDIYCYLVKRLGESESLYLLCELEDEGIMSLYRAIWENKSISNVLSLLKDETQIHQLLSHKDDEGRTVLSLSIDFESVESFQSIISHYTDKQARLLELAAMTDKARNTSFHYAAGQKTSNFLTILIRSTCSVNTRDELANVLAMRNIRGDKSRFVNDIEEWHSDNELIYDWALDSMTKNRYMLFGLPSVLILYNVVTREHGAEAEAQSLIQCFKEIGSDVKHSNSFTKKQLFNAIKECHGTAASKNGQIVALMSHGCEGYIEDSKSDQILFREIEQKMCGSHAGTPKLLIIQCCQDPIETNQGNETRSRNASVVINCSTSSHPVDARGANHQRPPASYCPCYADFCTLMSTGARATSERNTFIPFLAEAIREAGVNVSISDVMRSVSKRFPVRGPVEAQDQAPGFQDWFKFDFCIKNILPIYLDLVRKTK